MNDTRPRLRMSRPRARRARMGTRELEYLRRVVGPDRAALPFDDSAELIVSFSERDSPVHPSQIVMIEGALYLRATPRPAVGRGYLWETAR